jgi:hypothetical protein
VVVRLVVFFFAFSAGWRFAFAMLFFIVVVISLFVLLLLTEHDDIHCSSLVVMLY